MPWLCGTLSQKQRKEFFQFYPEDISMIYVLLEQCYSFQVNIPDTRKRKRKCLWFTKRHKLGRSHLEIFCWLKLETSDSKDRCWMYLFSNTESIIFQIRDSPNYCFGSSPAIKDWVCSKYVQFNKVIWAWVADKPHVCTASWLLVYNKHLASLEWSTSWRQGRCLRWGTCLLHKCEGWVQGLRISVNPLRLCAAAPAFLWCH